MSTRTLTLALAAVALAALLAACGKKTPEAPDAKPAGPAAARTAAPQTPATPAHGLAAGSSTRAAASALDTTFRVASVTLGSAVDAEQRVSAPATHFAQDTATLYASVASTGATRDATLGARWNYLEGTGRLVSAVTQRLATEGPAITTFSLHNPDLWPEGKYSVEISVDGKPVQTQAFTIGK